MSDPDSHSPTGPKPPGRQLSRRGLTILLIIVAATPVVAVLYLWNTLPPVQQRPLKVALEQVDAIAPEPNSVSQTVAPIDPAKRRVQFRNNSDEVWSNVAVTVNERFHFHRPGTLAPGETVEIYLAQFAMRSGGHFDPAVIDVTSVEIAARLPSGARGLFAAEAPFNGETPETDAAH